MMGFNPFVRVRRAARFLMAKQVPKDYEDEKVPTSCPLCSAPIELNAETGIWKCLGIRTLEEAQAFLAPLFSGNVLPKSIEIPRPSCEWQGKDSEFGTVWR